MCRQKVSYGKLCADHDLPDDDGALDVPEFARFVECRRKLLRERLKDALQ
jgi:hypothetical protein